MTRQDDRFPDMLSGTQIDAAIDQALNDATVTDDVAPFAGFVDDLRLMADRPAPRPSAELVALLAGHHAAEPEAGATVASLQPRRPHLVQARAATRMRVAALGLAGKAAMVIALATTAVAGAAAGILPEPATQFVRRVIEVVTPFQLPATGQDAPHEHATAAATKAADATAAGKPGHISPDAVTQRAPTVHRSDGARTPAPDGEPLLDTTVPVPPNVAKATGNALVRLAEPSAPAAGPQPSDDADNGRPPDHQPPVGPAPKNGHVPPGQALPGAPHPGGGRPGDAPPEGPDSDPEPQSAPNGPPAKAGSPRGSTQAPGRQGPHRGRPGGPGPAHEPGCHAPSEPGSDAPGRPQRPGPSPGGEPGRDTQGNRRQDPAPPAAGRRSESDTRSTPASGEPRSATPPRSA